MNPSPGFAKHRLIAIQQRASVSHPCPHDAHKRIHEIAFAIKPVVKKNGTDADLNTQRVSFHIPIHPM